MAITRQAYEWRGLVPRDVDPAGIISTGPDYVLGPPILGSFTLILPISGPQQKPWQQYTRNGCLIQPPWKILVNTGTYSLLSNTTNISKVVPGFSTVEIRDMNFERRPETKIDINIATHN